MDIAHPPLPIAYQPGCCGSTAEVLDDAAAQRVADELRVLADPVRLKLLSFIGSSPGTTVCACHLPGALGISQPTLSHHLKKLVEAGFVTRERRGKWYHYTLVEDAVDRVRAALPSRSASASAGASQLTR